MRRWRVLRHPNVRRYFGGYVPSQLGTAISSVALAFAVLDSGGTASQLGLVFAAMIVAQVLLMVGGGVVADRLGRRRVMLGADLLRTLSQGLLAGLLFAGHPPIWAFIALAATLGAGDALAAPAFSGLIVDIAPPDEVADANALFGLAESATQVAGPALAAIIIAVGDPATAIALDAVSYAVSAVALRGLRLPAVDRSASRSIRSDLVAGWDEFRRRSWLWTVTIQFALFNLIAWGPFLLLGPVLSREDLSGARSWGTILAASALGSVVGGVVALGRRPRRPLVLATLGTFAYPIPLVLLAVRAPTLAIAAGALVQGVGSATFNIFFAATIQREVPPDAQARVAAFDMVGAFSAGPIAFAAAGPVASLVGARTILAVGAAWTVASSLVVIALPAIRAVRWTAEPTGESNAPGGKDHSDARRS